MEGKSNFLNQTPQEIEGGGAVQGSGKLPSSTQLPISNPPAPILGWMRWDME